MTTKHTTNVPRNVADADRIRKEGELREPRERDPISESSEFSHSHRDESTREHNIWRWWRWKETTAIRAREEGAAELCNMGSGLILCMRVLNLL